MYGYVSASDLINNWIVYAGDNIYLYLHLHKSYCWHFTYLHIADADASQQQFIIPE